MGYSILRFQQNDHLQWGVLKGNKIAPFAEDVNHLKELMDQHLSATK